MVGRVGDGQVALVAEPVGEEVVEDATVLAAEHRVLRAADLELRDVVGEQPLKQVERAGALGFDLAHVGDVEDAAGLADGEVLLAARPRTGPASPSRRTGRARAGGDVRVVEGGVPQRLHAIAEASDEVAVTADGPAGSRPEPPPAGLDASGGPAGVTPHRRAGRPGRRCRRPATVRSRRSRVAERAHAPAAQRSRTRIGLARQRLEALEAGGDHGDAHLVAHRLVDYGAEDDVGALVGLLDGDARPPRRPRGGSGPRSR